MRQSDVMSPDLSLLSAFSRESALLTRSSVKRSIKSCCLPFQLADEHLASQVLYMSFDRFLLAFESRDLSQADKSIIRVSSFSILQNFNFSGKK